jgi:hypothetical protein
VCGLACQTTFLLDSARRDFCRDTPTYPECIGMLMVRPTDCYTLLLYRTNGTERSQTASKGCMDHINRPKQTAVTNPVLLLKQALIPTLQEAGCEGMFETHGRATRISWSSLRSSPLRPHISFTLNRTTRSGCLQQWRACWLEPRS